MQGWMNAHPPPACDTTVALAPFLRFRIHVCRNNTNQEIHRTFFTYWYCLFKFLNQSQRRPIVIGTWSSRQCEHGQRLVALCRGQVLLGSVHVCRCCPRVAQTSFTLSFEKERWFGGEAFQSDPNALLFLTGISFAMIPFVEVNKKYSTYEYTY